MARHLPTLVSTLLIAIGAAAQSSVPLDLEVGYRWTDVDGNEDLYRTQINDEDGFVIRSLSFFTHTNGLTDHVRIDVNELGSGPAGSFRLETGKSNVFLLRVTYRDFDTYSALPAFANPLLGQGIVPGQHTFDRTRKMFDADLELWTDGTFTPFVGYSQGSFEGPGTTTYTLGGDDFLLDQDLDETEHEFRIGTGFNTGKFYGSVTQGWRRLESDETLSLFEGAGAGNNANTVLGRNIGASLLTRESSSNTDTPFTTVFVTAEAMPRLRLTGSYMRFSAENEGAESEDASGTFVSFPISRFFTGMSEQTRSSAQNTSWRGSVRGEFTLTTRLDLLGGYRSESRDMSGQALIDTLFTGTTNFSGFDPRDIQEVLEAESALDRQVDTIDVAVAARSFGPFSARVGFSQAEYDFEVDPDVSEIVVPGNQEGDFDRRVNTFDAHVAYAHTLFSLGAAYRRDDADDAVLRTDFLSRSRLRFRAGFHTPSNFIRVGLVGENVDQKNDEDGVGFDAEARHFTGDVEVAPMSSMRFRASYSILRTDSTMVIRRPETFQLETSDHREDGDALELGVALDFAKLDVDLAASRFDNEGSLPFTVDRVRTRVAYDFLTNVGVAAEWNRDNYDEAVPSGAYDSDRFGVFVRYRR